MAGVAGSGFDVASAVPIPAAVPDSWMAGTIGAISHSAATGSPATAGAVSASVTLLVGSVLRRMAMMKLKALAIGLSLIGMGAAGVILAAPQADSGRTVQEASRGPRTDQRQTRIPIPATQAVSKKVLPPLPQQRYVVEPPDILLVEVREALPGRPISGERLVRPDGKISLGFYGEVYVAGLTLKEAKAKIVLHLRKYLSDEDLGLLERNRATGDYRRDENSRLLRKEPGDTDRVLVDITAYNSKSCYVLGDVREPGKFPLKGNETVLDALQFAGGLMPVAAPRDIRLVRPAPPGVCCEQVLPVRLEAITTGGDPTTNYQLMSGDRLIVSSRPGSSSDEAKPSDLRPATMPRGASQEPRRTDRRDPAVRTQPPDAVASEPEEAPDDRPALRDVQRRLVEVERKLDRVLDALNRREP
jgi:protein involved in polysaccharide export with SLBB domain